MNGNRRLFSSGFGDHVSLKILLLNLLLVMSVCADEEFQFSLKETKEDKSWCKKVIKYEAFYKEGAIQLFIWGNTTDIELAWWLSDSPKLKPRYRPKSPVTLALNYALSQWDQQKEYLTNGHLEIDNNLAENAVRPTKLGMKNWLFFGSSEAGHTSAHIYTLIENCKRQELNPESYLKEVLTHLPQDPTAEEAAALTPKSVAKAKKCLPKVACQ